MLVKHMFKTAVVLALFAFSVTGLVTLTQWQTKDEILASETRALKRSLNAVLDPALYNNALLADTITVQSEKFLGVKKPQIAFRARLDNKPIAIILNPIAPDGYNGEIKLLVAVMHDGRLSGVRVLGHRETPGLGDAIEARRSHWIHDFNQKTLTNPTSKKWRVKKDGGVFDQFTGATITPRAIVKAVHKTLLYVEQNKEMLFSAAINNVE